ncbi:type I restriction-modification system DNA-methyltransferase subunit M [Jejuia pallidilutea]|uniref:site-specific DNA-methyltransferase (adenine-specific) n=3 Tax=Jejuia pallidilutea TaxID=504487 RepID=A0A090WLI0_9FLAO|nr:class I SAM-dependent DNA methyltransferase [Jejuia pallidilutea]GAL68327.1 type I restriction-modification system DNA-methyltransferase subunit M [Jejuia pallidilutea]GAL88844.1 type I restriction-modification system DNA-methyltransferase subunit M [Jejuia pallidilutea]
MKLHESMITGELKSKIDKIWNDFWTGGISNPLTVIEQFTYLIFLKQLDSKQMDNEKAANLLGIPLENAFYSKKHEPLRWSSFKEKDPEVMFDLFTKPQRELDDLTVFDFMKNIGKQGGVFAQYMKGAIFMIPTPKLLDKVVQQIDSLNLDNKDAKGDLYEYMLSKIAEAGTNGQFRTPRHIIRMMVQIVKPQQDDVICDPSSGTAGFLVSAGEYVYHKHKEWFNNKTFRNHFNNHMFNGIEFDPTMLRIGAMNMQLHGMENPTLIGKDALSESNGDIENQYSLILANPPFKGSLDYDEVESSLLKVTKTKKTELLFLALMLRMLKIGGRAAVIVPDGVLFGSSTAHKNIRKELVQNQQLQAVISMPSGVFKPYAGVSTAILFFTKTNSGGTDKVWFYDMKADGLSLDDKRNLLVDKDTFEQCFTHPETMVEAVKGKCDIPQILLDAKVIMNSTSLRGGTTKQSHETTAIAGNAKQSHHTKFSDRTQQSFTVPFEEIKANDWDLSINRYKEMVYEEIEYEKPETLIAQIKDLDKQRNDALLNLEKMMG